MFKNQKYYMRLKLKLLKTISEINFYKSLDTETYKIENANRENLNILNSQVKDSNESFYTSESFCNF